MKRIIPIIATTAFLALPSTTQAQYKPDGFPLSRNEHDLTVSVQGGSPLPAREFSGSGYSWYPDDVTKQPRTFLDTWTRGKGRLGGFFEVAYGSPKILPFDLGFTAGAGATVGISTQVTHFPNSSLSQEDDNTLFYARAGLSKIIFSPNFKVETGAGAFWDGVGEERRHGYPFAYVDLGVLTGNHASVFLQGRHGFEAGRGSNLIYAGFRIHVFDK